MAPEVCPAHEGLVDRIGELRVDIRDLRDDLLAELRSMREASEKRAEGSMALRRDIVGLARHSVERVTQPAVAVPLLILLTALVVAAAGVSVTYRDLVIRAADGAVDLATTAPAPGAEPPPDPTAPMPQP